MSTRLSSCDDAVLHWLAATVRRLDKVMAALAPRPRVIRLADLVPDHHPYLEWNPNASPFVPLAARSLSDKMRTFTNVGDSYDDFNPLADSGGTLTDDKKSPKYAVGSSKHFDPLVNSGGLSVDLGLTTRSVVDFADEAVDSENVKDRPRVHAGPWFALPSVDTWLAAVPTRSSTTHPPPAEVASPQLDPCRLDDLIDAIGRHDFLKISDTLATSPGLRKDLEKVSAVRKHMLDKEYDAASRFEKPAAARRRNVYATLRECEQRGPEEARYLAEDLVTSELALTN